MKIFRHFSILLFASALCPASNCKEPKKKPPVDIGFLAIDSTCKQYWAFKEGSYWVYENKKGGKNGIPGLLDTIKCSLFEKQIVPFETEYWKGTKEKYFFVHDQVNTDEYGNMQSLEYNIEALVSPYSSQVQLNDWWALERFQWKPYGGFGTYLVYPYTAAGLGLERFIADTTINGINYKDVIVMYDETDGQLPDRLTTHATFTYWAKGVGIVRYVTSKFDSNDIWDFQLKEYNVIKE